VIEAGTTQEDGNLDRAIAIFEASQQEEDDPGASRNSDQGRRFPVLLDARSDEEEVTLLQSIQVLKAMERKLTPTLPEFKSAPRIRRYFDSADSLKCFNCGARGHFSQACTEEHVKPCYLCAHPGHLERTCPNQLCFRCHLAGHVAIDCHSSVKSPPLRACPRCGSLKHSLLKCTYKVRKDSAELASVRCFICGNNGHLCCRNSRKLSKRPQFCSNCASKGHWHFDCPQQNRMTSYYDSLKSKPNPDNSRGLVCSTESEWCFVCQVVGHRAGNCPSSDALKPRIPKPKKRFRETSDATSHAPLYASGKKNRRKPAMEKHSDPDQTGGTMRKDAHAKVARKRPEIVLRDGRWVS